MFKPKSIKDLVGNPTAHKKLEEMIKDKTPALLVGPPGVGKTSGVHVIAEELGYEVVEVNASDERRVGDDDKPGELKRVLWRSQMNAVFGEKYLIFLDEIDGMGAKNVDGPSSWDVVKKILLTSKWPVVMACNEEYKVPDSIKKMAIKIEFRRADVRTVAKLVQRFGKDVGMEPNMDVIGGDIRAGLMAIFGGEGYSPSGDFTDVQRFFVEGGDFDPERYVWIMDNIPNFFKGYDMYLAYKVLGLASSVNKSALDMLPKGRAGRVKYPTFWLARRKVNDDSGDG